MLWPARIKTGRKPLYRSLSVTPAVVHQPVGYGGVAHHHPRKSSGGNAGQHMEEHSSGAINQHTGGYSGGSTDNYMEGYPV